MSDRPERLVARLGEDDGDGDGGGGGGGGIDLLLVTELVNLRYLTGYTGSHGLALIGPDTRLFVTDFRYVQRAAAEVDSSYDRRQDPGRGELLIELDDALPAGELRLGFDDEHLSVRQHARLRELMPERVTLVAAGGLVERLREVKDAGEITRIRAAAALADAALSDVLAGGLAGRTERAIADALETAIRDGGGRGVSFEPIVAAGAHGALPHAEPREVVVQAGELVTIDWGAALEGYCSDCTRTYAAGEPGERAREIYELVRTAQQTGLDAVRAGVAGREVDAAARGVIEAAGFGPEFGHALGHGVGMEVHELPRVSRRSHDVLRAGSVVTIEPGVYLAGELGVRIEDLVVVGDAGPEVLTSLDKTLTVVG